MEEQGLTLRVDGNTIDDSIKVSVNDDTISFNQVIEAILRFDKDICHKYMFIPYLKSEVIDNDIHIHCKSDDEIGTLIIGTSSLIRRQGLRCAELTVIITNPLTGLDFEYVTGSILLFNNWNNEYIENLLDRIYTYRDVENDYMENRNNGALDRVSDRYRRKKFVGLQLATRLNMYLNMHIEDDVEANDKFNFKILDIDDPDIAIIALPTSYVKKNGEIVSHYIVQKVSEYVSNYTGPSGDKLIEVNYMVYRVTLENEDDKEYKSHYMGIKTPLIERYGAYSVAGSLYGIVNSDTYRNIYVEDGRVRYSNSKHISILEQEPLNIEVNFYSIFKYIVNDLESK